MELNIRSNGRKQYDRYFANEYTRIDATNVGKNKPEYSVSLEVVDRIPDDLEHDAIVRIVKFKNLFTYKYAITGLGTTKVIVYFQDHPVRHIYTTAVGVFIQAQVLEPVMYYCFLKQNVLLMHSAGVSKDNSAYVFPAYGGTGKTTTSMSLLAKGYKFLGDDLLVVDPAKQLVFPYPRPLHIFTYNIRNLNGAKIPIYTSFVIYFKNILRYFLEAVLREEFLISTRIHADEILSNFQLSPPANLHNLIFLKKEGAHETVNLDSEEVIEKHACRIVQSADLNRTLFEIVANDALKNEIKDMELQVVAEILKNVNYFGYLNTRMINLDDVEMYLGDVEVND